MPKKKNCTIQDIADELGVSKSLVSFVLNGKSKEKRVSDQMSQKVMEVAMRMNYKPNYLAKSLRTGKSHTIALIIADISNPFFARFARFLELEASKYNYKVIFANSDEKREKFASELSVLKNRQVDGFVLIPPIGSEAELQALRKQKVPFVIVDRMFTGVDSHVVIVDNYKAGYEATKRLIQNNRKRIAILNVNNGLITMSQRVEGYLDALRDHGIAVDNKLIKQLKFSHEKKSVMKSIDEVVEEGVDALFFTTSKLTILGIECLRERGVLIPAQVAVISFDDLDAFKVTFTPISAVVQPVEQMSKRAIQLLIREIEGEANENMEKNNVFDVDFVFRESCI